MYEYKPYDGQWFQTPSTYPTYTIPTTTTSRWHCPDCKGWVVDWLPVHHCSVQINTTNNTYITNKTSGKTRVEFDENNEVKFVKSVN